MNANLMTMLITFFMGTIVLYILNIYFDMRRRKVPFKKSFKYLPNIIEAVLASMMLNILKWGIVTIIILTMVMMFLLDSVFKEDEE